MIARAAGTEPGSVTDAQLAEFKAAVTHALSPHASAVLLDPEYGLEAVKQKSPSCGLLLTYESDGFENPRPHRMLALMPHFSVRRLQDLGARGIKILLSYSPAEIDAANDQKKAMIERIGYECEAAGIPFLLEPVVYDPAGLDAKSLEFARHKPEWVIRTMEEFSKPIYCVDVLKVEFPVTAAYVEDSSVYSGKRAHSMQEALEWYRAADAVARCPYIYLSAGVASNEFIESLRFATESGARFSGVLCGRANWQEGVAPYARGGVKALERWLAGDGVRNMQRVSEALRRAHPWTEWFESEPQTEKAKQ